MLDALNDDCWLAIIKYLSLSNQIALCKAAQGHSKRLNSSMIYAWEHQLRFKLNEENLKQFEAMPDVLDIFLRSISATIEELHLEFAKVEFLRRWQSYTFPKIKTLECILDDSHCYKPDAAEAIEIMVQLFPGLRTVKFDSDFSRQSHHMEWGNGCPKAIAQWRLLEEMTLSYHFRLSLFNDAIKALSKLHTLSFHRNECDIDLGELLERRGKDVHRMIFNDCIGKYRKLGKLNNLRHLTLLRDKGFTSENLRELVVNLKQLEQLDLIDFMNWYDEKELWQIVARCPSLRILNISGMDLDEDFFEFSRRAMEETLRNRSQPLTLHCDNTDDIEKMIRQHFKHQQLMLSFEPLQMDLIGWNTVRMHFKPLLGS